MEGDHGRGGGTAGRDRLALDVVAHQVDGTRLEGQLAGVPEPEGELVLGETLTSDRVRTEHVYFRLEGRNTAEYQIATQENEELPYLAILLDVQYGIAPRRPDIVSSNIHNEFSGQLASRPLPKLEILPVSRYDTPKPR